MNFCASRRGEKHLFLSLFPEEPDAPRVSFHVLVQGALRTAEGGNRTESLSGRSLIRFPDQFIEKNAASCVVVRREGEGFLRFPERDLKESFSVRIAGKKGVCVSRDSQLYFRFVPVENLPGRSLFLQNALIRVQETVPSLERFVR